MIRVVATFMLTISLGLCVTQPKASSYPLATHGLRIFHQAFNVETDAGAEASFTSAVASLDEKAFRGRLSALDDRTALNQFIATVATQAVSEHWRLLRVDMWVGGKMSPTGYYVRYTAIDLSGKSIYGGALIATDKAAARSADHDELLERGPQD